MGLDGMFLQITLIILLLKVSQATTDLGGSFPGKSCFLMHFDLITDNCQKYLTYFLKPKEISISLISKNIFGSSVRKKSTTITNSESASFVFLPIMSRISSSSQTYVVALDTISFSLINSVIQ